MCATILSHHTSCTHTQEAFIRCFIAHTEGREVCSIITQNLHGEVPVWEFEVSYLCEACGKREKWEAMGLVSGFGGSKVVVMVL